MPKYVRFKKDQPEYYPKYEVFEVLEETVSTPVKYCIFLNGSEKYFWATRFDIVSRELDTWPPKKAKRKYSSTFQKDVVYK